MPSKNFKTNSAYFASLQEKEEAIKDGKTKTIPVTITSKPTKGRQIKVPTNADPEPTEERASAPDIPEGFKLVPAETKSKRLQLLITPSLHRKLQDLAKAENISINEIANRAIENYLKGGF